jgi:F0F1-type ATP synthase membrane subunit b/b'
MSPRKSIPLVLFLLPFFLFFASEEEHHEANPAEFIGKVVNFFILFGGLTYLLYKPVRKFLEGRSKEISHSIQESRESRQDAEMRLTG